jgi:hypothetical protein
MKRGKVAPAGRVCPEVAVWRIFAALLGRVVCSELRLQRNDAPSLAGAFKNPLNFKTPAGEVFSPGHPPPRRREPYQPSIHMLNFTYEDDK